MLWDVDHRRCPSSSIFVTNQRERCLKYHQLRRHQLNHLGAAFLLAHVQDVPRQPWKIASACLQSFRNVVYQHEGLAVIADRLNAVC